MKKLSKLSILLSSIAMAAGVITFSSSKLNQKNNHDELNGAEYIGEVSNEIGPVFYPASYSTDITNEPYYSTQNSKTFSLMNFSLAPDRYRGESVKVAVIDSGINYSHEDFGNLKPESGTIDSTSGSWVYYKYGLGYQSKLNDTSGHGTNVASVIASQINNLGCAGISPNVDLYVFKVTNSSNGYEWTAIDNALQYCIDNHVDVVNMSFQAYEHAVSYGSSSMGASTNCSTVLTTKLNNCYNAGITLVGAAGNYNTNEPSYPASNNHVISVGSLADGSTTQKAGFSNTYGIDLVAPGYVQAADKGSSYAYTGTSGTSFSAPIVTAAIALYKQKYPDATPSDIESALYDSCDEISGNPSWAGHGRLNVDRFLGLDENSPQSISITSPSDDTLELQVGETYQLQYSVEPSTFTGDVEFTTYETGAISVSSSGLITALAEGEDTVSINPVGFSNINDEIDVTVVPKASVEVETYSDSKTVSLSNSKVGTWDISPQTTYCGLYYSGKNSSATITNKSISEFSNFATSTESSLTVYVDGICNSGTNSVKVSTINSSGEVVETSTALTNKLGSGSSSTNAKSVGPFTFTPGTSVTGLKIEIGSKCCVTKVSYSYSYTKEITGGGSTTTKTLSSISLSGQKTEFSVGETWSFGGTVTANYSDNSHADVTNHVTFSGNSTSATGTKTVTVFYTEGDVTKTATYNITVSAQAVTNYTVTFKSNGGTGSMTSKNTNGSTYVTPTCSFTYTGYTFDKWALNSESGTKYSPGQTISGISSNITLYATWTQNSASGDFNGYYSTIDANSSSLLSDLTTLNLSKRKKQVGYNSMGTGTSTNPDNSPYMYTDYDPSTVKYNSANQPYGTKILSFYSGNSTTGWNKEHVWPASRLTGGRNDNIVDDDIYMARPTISSENSNRGNSVFYEGMAHSSNGWDPVTAFGTNGVYSSIRGECARIIFYCMTVDSSLVLNESTSNSGNNMGRLTDLLKWNLENPVNDREVRRQSGGEYLQGNRNAFVDHPEYACKIWGNTSDATRKICSMDPVTNKKLVDLTVSGSPTKTVYQKGDSFSSSGLTITAIFDDESTSNVTSSVVWTPNPLDEGMTEVTGSYTYLNETKTVKITGLTVNPWTVVNGDYTLEFKNSTADGSGELTSKAIMSDDYLKLNTLASEMTSVSKVYAGTYGLKLGSSGSAGSFTVNLVDGAKNGIKSIDIYSKKYSSDSGTIKFTLGSKSGSFTPTTTGTKQTQTFDEPISAQTLKIETSSKRGYVQKVVLHVEDSSTPKVTSVTLDPKTLSFDLYQSTATKTITAAVLGDSGVDTSVIWTSSNESVATVVNGVVTPVGVGQATITATSTADSTKSDTCIVTVSDSTPAAVSGVTLNKGSTTLVIGSSETLIATVNPQNAGNKNVTWSTNNASVATVSNGTVNAIAAGTATITVTTEEGGYTSSCTVTVTAAPVITYQLEADKETIPYMSGTNHQVSVGVKLYKYSNGVKGSQVASSTGSVDTSVLGPAKISYTYQSVTYETSVKVTNNGAIQNIEGTSTNKSSTFTKSIFTKNETQKVDNLSLTLQNNGGFYGYDSTKGQQIGSSGNSAKSMSLTTSVEGTITKVIVNTSGGSSVSATVSVKVGSTSFKCGTSTSKSISATATSYEFTGSATGDVVISWSQTSSKALYFKSIEITTTTEGTKVFSNEEQAKAWSDYFIKLTGGGEFDGPCKLETPEAKKAALQQVWGELKSEYVYMNEGSKTAFCASDATESIAEAVQHYCYIVNTYGLEDFAEVPKVNNSNRLTTMSDSEPFVVGLIAMVGLAAIGGYFFYRRRREDKD